MLIKNKTLKFKAKKSRLMNTLMRNMVLMCFSAFVLNTAILAHADVGYFSDNKQKIKEYIALLGRTSTMDPKAEKYYPISPYSWCASNPVRFVDENGKDWVKNETNNKVFKTLPIRITWPIPYKSYLTNKK